MESKDNSWRDATAEFALKVSNVDLLREGFKKKTKIGLHRPKTLEMD